MKEAAAKSVGNTGNLSQKADREVIEPAPQLIGENDVPAYEVFSKQARWA
jgi:hypothetical protein